MVTKPERRFSTGLAQSSCPSRLESQRSARRDRRRAAPFALPLKSSSGMLSTTMESQSASASHAQVEAFGRRHRIDLVTMVSTDLVGLPSGLEP